MRNDPKAQHWEKSKSTLGKSAMSGGRVRGSGRPQLGWGLDLGCGARITVSSLCPPVTTVSPGCPSWLPACPRAGPQAEKPSRDQAAWQGRGKVIASNQQVSTCRYVVECYQSALFCSIPHGFPQPCLPIPPPRPFAGVFNLGIRWGRWENLKRSPPAMEA